MYGNDSLNIYEIRSIMSLTSINTVALGIMSGTSLDGIDFCLSRFSGSLDNLQFNILKAKTTSYPKHWVNQLQNATGKTKENLNNLDVEYGRFLANATQSFINNSHIKPDFIASHGHTIHHQPELNYTLQIGNGPEIFSLTKIPVVCNFRVQDVMFGGQGAPLVPIGDEMLFSEFTYCLNMGGFANVSFKENNERIAFDICPVNIAINHYANQLGFSFDQNGSIAKNAIVNQTILNKLDKLQYYSAPSPKSLGKEWVEQNIFPLLDVLNPEIAIATITEHAAKQIGKTLKNGTTLVTGGGTYNQYLMTRIADVSKSKIVKPTSNLVEFKEALIFALLGLLKLNDRINCLSSVTGASKDHSSGVIYC